MISSYLILSYPVKIQNNSLKNLRISLLQHVLNRQVEFLFLNNNYRVAIYNFKYDFAPIIVFFRRNKLNRII